MAAEQRFRAMGTDVHVVVHGPAGFLDLAHEEICRLEQLWSRFLPTSEVSRLNAAAGSWLAVSPETMELVQRAVEGHHLTRGLFDPTVLGDLIRAGYDRSFPELIEQGEQAGAPNSDLGRGTDAIEVDPGAPAVRLPVGVGFDAGGLGKGLAADLVANRLDTEGVAGVLVNVGGDLRAMGVGPDGDDWTIEIDPAASGTPVATVAMEQGAVATSTVLRRRWRTAGQARHHLIDPTTGDPASTGVVAATVLAARGWQAEVLAKVALIAGITTGFDLVTALGGEAMAVDDRGGLHRTPGFDRFLSPGGSPAMSSPDRRHLAVAR
jgi:thiamine biosynthesis lipoprotein